MPSTTPRLGNEVLAKAIAASPLYYGRRPVPLISTAYKISICAGLADIEATRTFRNAEKGSIEAALTFPMPVHAVVYALEARIGGRTLHARIRPRADARADYESAIDRGKTAVLHEELLRGVHLLSVGHIAPGTEVTVTARFALALACVGSRVYLRVPLTVGDIYGDPGLPDSDALTHGGPVQMGTLEIACDSGTPVLVGGTLSEGKAAIPLNAPLVVEIENWRPRALYARSASRRLVKLSIDPAPQGDGSIDAAVLVDHSGSMNETCASGAGLNKHAAALLGLSEAAAILRDGDRLHLFEFDDDVNDLGVTTAAGWRQQLHLLAPPCGGTEIGRALDTVRKTTEARDILLVTDGKSHALDVQKLARSGKRFSVVLIGEDSLEANVAHLAALTGGDILVPDGTKVASAVVAMFGFIRMAGAGTGLEQCVRRSGMVIAIAAPEAGEPITPIERAAAAYAASIRLAGLPESAAVRLAEAEGLLTHMTSFILVDEDGRAEQGLPAMRKVDLPSPRTAAACGMKLTINPSSFAATVRCMAAPRQQASEADHFRRRAYSDVISPDLGPADSSSRSTSRNSRADAEKAAAAGPSPWHDLSSIGPRISWATCADRLAAGDLSALAPGAAERVRDAGSTAIIRKLASKLGIRPTLLVIAMIALSLAASNRHAARVARSILGQRARSGISGAAEWFGLVIPRSPSPPLAP